MTATELESIRKKYSERVIQNTLTNAIENCIAREQRLAEEYSKINPAEAKRRWRNAELVIFGMTELKAEIEKEFERMDEIRRTAKAQ